MRLRKAAVELITESIMLYVQQLFSINNDFWNVLFDFHCSRPQFLLIFACSSDISETLCMRLTENS